MVKTEQQNIPGDRSQIAATSEVIPHPKSYPAALMLKLEIRIVILFRVLMMSGG